MKLLLAVSLIASVATTNSSIPPKPVSQHVKNGHFDPGDYSWLRGAFPGASAEQDADWKAISAYADHCSGAVPDLVRAEMAALGEHPPADYWHQYADDICGEIVIARHSIDGFKSWPDYYQALNIALPYYQTFVFAVARAQAAAPIDTGSLSDHLQAIVIPDQMLRAAISWGQGDASDAPPLNSKAQTVLTRLLWRPIRDIDHRNTAWLKGIIFKNGWPVISKVGKQAASNAWLLAQHADDDPVFQLRVLRLIGPLAAREEVDRQNYALLYDRVMLPLTGKQRYGTQFTCDAKGWHPLPLENEVGLDGIRKGAGLDPIAAYTKQLIAGLGEHCSN